MTSYVYCKKCLKQTIALYSNTTLCLECFSKKAAKETKTRCPPPKPGLNIFEIRTLDEIPNDTIINKTRSYAELSWLWMNDWIIPILLMSLLFFVIIPLSCLVAIITSIYDTIIIVWLSILDSIPTILMRN